MKTRVEYSVGSYTDDTYVHIKLGIPSERIDQYVELIKKLEELREMVDELAGPQETN